MKDYKNLHASSLTHPERFWLEKSELIDWYHPPSLVCDDSNPPFAEWFPDASLNLCYNAVDRHLRTRPDQNALVYFSSETGQEKVYSYRELHVEVQRMAAVFLELGVSKGSRVLIYMPMIAEAVFAMLACARIGAVHSVVFGGFASHALATRIDDAKPVIVVSADAGSRAGKVIPYKSLLDRALELAVHKPTAVLLANRQLAPMKLMLGRDHLLEQLLVKHECPDVPCVPLESAHPSYILYTSGTTGTPKGVVRDTGGHAVALAASMRDIFDVSPGECFFSTSDVGWVVGHSYIVYGPLIAGVTTILYDGIPTNPDPGVWWRLADKYKVTGMFSSPTALRVLRKHGEAWMQGHDLSSLRALFLAGEPLDISTSSWASTALKIPIFDNYWQTESGWPILAVPAGNDELLRKTGSPGIPCYGYDVGLFDETTGVEIVQPGQKGVIGIRGPTPPGFMKTIWGDNERYKNTYWSSIAKTGIYSTFDWAERDEDGYFFILGRTDDVINVAGHRLGTREIEESLISHPNVIEAAVIGLKNELKGQEAVAFVVLRESTTSAGYPSLQSLTSELYKQVEMQLGAIARPSKIYYPTAIPKTRSGKVLRRAIQAICEGTEPGDLSTIEDLNALRSLEETIKQSSFS
ncbi:MAG: propionate--CoA ligase [Pseudomonadota bacterium]